jgi:hypothetical protein
MLLYITYMHQDAWELGRESSKRTNPEPESHDTRGHRGRTRGKTVPSRVGVRQQSRKVETFTLSIRPHSGDENDLLKRYKSLYRLFPLQQAR